MDGVTDLYDHISFVILLFVILRGRREGVRPNWNDVTLSYGRVGVQKNDKLVFICTPTLP